MFSICTALLIGYTNEVVPWMFPAPDSLKNAERLKAVKCNFYKELSDLYRLISYLHFRRGR